MNDIVSSSNRVLETLHNAFTSDNYKDEASISLYDVLMILKSINNNYKKMMDSYAEKLDQIVEMDSYTSSFLVHSFDYKQKELHTSYKHYTTWGDINFKKRNGDLYISEKNSIWASDVFGLTCNVLSDLFDDCMKYEDFFGQDSYRIRSANLPFLVNVSRFGINIYLLKYSSLYEKEFKFSAYSYSDKYDCECNSGNVISMLKEREEMFLKNIYIRIEDCPEWSKEMLYEIRLKELAKRQKEEEERKQREIKEQRKLELKKKIFPWIK